MHSGVYINSWYGKLNATFAYPHYDKDRQMDNDNIFSSPSHIQDMADYLASKLGNLKPLSDEMFPEGVIIRADVFYGAEQNGFIAFIKNKKHWHSTHFSGCYSFEEVLEFLSSDDVNDVEIASEWHLV